MTIRVAGTAAARTFLYECIQKQKTGRLPSLENMAQLAQVSRKTMWKAVGELTNAGVLSSKQGRGIYIGELPAAEPPIRKEYSCMYRWVRTKTALLSDCTIGTFRHTPRLPSHKELLQKYSVNSRTLRKSLAALVSEGIIKHEYGGYTIIRPQGARGALSTIMLILPGNLLELMQFSYYTLGMQSFYILLERECSSRGIMLKRCTYTQAIHDVKQLQESMGCICWVGGNEHEATGFFKSLPAIKPPIAIIDYFTAFNLPDECSGIHSTLILTPDQQDSMHKLAHYALQMGHRHLAYFRQSDSKGWPESRLAGVKEALLSASMPCENLIIFDSRLSTTPALAEKNPQTVFDTLGAQVNALVKNATMRGMLNMKLGEANQYTEIEFSTAPAFAAALKRSEITAWICESQSLGVYGALPFLRAHNIRIPERLSVMGQGDAPEAFSSGLTSTSERMDLCLEEIMRHILYPELRKKSTCQKLTIPNIVVVRETSGKFYAGSR